MHHSSAHIRLFGTTVVVFVIHNLSVYVFHGCGDARSNLSDMEKEIIKLEDFQSICRWCLSVCNGAISYNPILDNVIEDILSRCAWFQVSS